MRNVTRWLTVSFCTATLGAGLAFADHHGAAAKENPPGSQEWRADREGNIKAREKRSEDSPLGGQGWRAREGNIKAREKRSEDSPLGGQGSARRRRVHPKGARESAEETEQTKPCDCPAEARQAEAVILLFGEPAPVGAPVARNRQRVQPVNFPRLRPLLLSSRRAALPGPKVRLVEMAGGGEHPPGLAPGQY